MKPRKTKPGRFDLATTSLARGVTRLEASAGTGKTFALTGLFLRLLLEENVPAQEILVVTYTEAATAELRERVRRRLAEALAAFEHGPGSDDLLKTLVGKFAGREKAAIFALRNALEIFDLVAICTIHSFCQRTLKETAFESGILFDVELVTDQSPLLREVAADYCRNQLHRPGDLLLASAALHVELSPELFARLLKQYLTYPELRLVPAVPPRPVEQVGAALQQAFDAIRQEWGNISQDQDRIVNYFVGGKQWATGPHNKLAEVELHLANLARCADPAGLSGSFWDAVNFFSSAEVEASVGSKKQLPPSPPAIFEICERLRTILEEYSLAHRLAFLQEAPAQLAARKQEAKQQSYDDLIKRLADALDQPSGPALVNSLRRRFRAALIDESQDTDPLQWKIFHRAFAESPDHWLYLIGDPKQAIYGFRGADVSTYLQAAETAANSFSLDTNYRSEKALVGGINAVFSAAGEDGAFVQPGIRFERVQAGPKAEEKPLLLPGGTRPPPLQVWSWEGTQGKAAIGEASKKLPAAVAAEISRLLRPGDAAHFNDSVPLQPRQIAILVESHKQAGWIQTALHSLGIPSVEQAMESVFESDEARELQWILAAILSPGKEPAIKAALTTDALGLTATRLVAMQADAAAWQNTLQQFAAFRETWDREGFFQMFTRLTRERQVIETLLRLPNAERRITNWLHLAELLETAGQTEHLGPSRVAQWLQERRATNEAAADEYQLRLESDEDAVQIVTIHRSKGLEYPVVFCPFVSKDAKLRSIRIDNRDVVKLVLFHDPAAGDLCWDLTPAPPEANKALAQTEQLAEKVRLLYVALTRARNRCYLVSASYAKNKSTALAWLLRPNSPVDPGQEANFLEANPPEAGEWKSKWERLAEANPGCLGVEDLPDAEGEAYHPGAAGEFEPGVRKCPREVTPAWGLSSFTGLASRLVPEHAHEPEADLPDHDQAGVPATALQPGPLPPLAGAEGSAEGEPPAPTMFALPGGARTGDCLHRILELADLSVEPGPVLERLVRRQLEDFDLGGDAAAAAVVQMINHLRDLPLDDADPPLRLSRIPPGHRLVELEFHLSAARLDAAALLKVIRGGRASAKIPGALRLGAFLKGYIDLVVESAGRFYIVDWKSNNLGDHPEAYNRETMARAIERSCYDLQYHLYAVALDGFLRRRLPGYDYENHFGGIRYIFLRGVTPGRPDLAVHTDRPPPARLAALRRAFGIGEVFA